MLSSSDVFRRSTETIPEPLDFAAGSGGGRFESSFQTLGCLVSRHGRLFVKSHDRERPQGDRDNFPDKTKVEWFERFDGASFCRGKNDPVLGECVYTKHRRTGTADTTLRNGDSKIESNLKGNRFCREIVVDTADDEPKIRFDDQTSLAGDSHKKERRGKNKRKLIRKVVQDGVTARFCA